MHFYTRSLFHSLTMFPKCINSNTFLVENTIPFFVETCNFALGRIKRWRVSSRIVRISWLYCVPLKSTWQSFRRKISQNVLVYFFKGAVVLHVTIKCVMLLLLASSNKDLHISCDGVVIQVIHNHRSFCWLTTFWCWCPCGKNTLFDPYFLTNY